MALAAWLPPPPSTPLPPLPQAQSGGSLPPPPGVARAGAGQLERPRRQLGVGSRELQLQPTPPDASGSRQGGSCRLCHQPPRSAAAMRQRQWRPLRSCRRLPRPPGRADDAELTWSDRHQRELGVRLQHAAGSGGQRREQQRRRAPLLHIAALLAHQRGGADRHRRRGHTTPATEPSRLRQRTPTRSCCG